MRSLRLRLTLSYAILVATVLTVAVVALTGVALQIFKRPLAEEILTAANTARAIARREAGHRSDVLIESAIVARVARLGLMVIPLPPRPRGFAAPDPPREPPPWWLGREFDLGALLIPPPARVHVGRAAVIIAADPSRLAWALAVYLEALAGAIVVVCGVAWFVGSWTTDQAIAPLIDVTTRLQEFAAGDFTPHALDTSDDSELGSLIVAYNGAAAQVTAAFAERTLAEEHMRRFIADAGHELRTPLAVVSGSLDVLRRGALDDDVLRERVFRTLETEMRRTQGLIERLTALARLERPEHSHPETLDVVQVARDVIAAVRTAREGEVTLAASAADAFAFADPSDVYDALGNLVDNALKYGAGTPVRVEIASSREAIAISVSDGGPGIPPGDRPHIFDRFYRGWMGRASGGSGLGLAIARRAAEHAGGSLELTEGEPGATAFRLTLPRSARSERPVELARER